MIDGHLRHLADLGRAALILAVASLLALAATVPALASPPTGDFAVFAQCPLKNPEVGLCVFSQSTGKEFVIGSSKVPVNKTVTLQGGLIIDEETGAETFVEAANGETLSKTALTVPGGLLGIIAPESLPKYLQEIINKLVSEGLDGVTATAELVGTPGINRSHLLSEEGTALSLPVRIKLSNILLGGECYIGSKSSPVTFNLTTGITSPPAPNSPIEGAIGEIEFKDEFQLAIITGDKLVDNAFSAPGVSGCGGLLSSLLDPAIDLKIGLPAASGHNTAILESELQNAGREGVLNSE